MHEPCAACTVGNRDGLKQALQNKVMHEPYGARTLCNIDEGKELLLKFLEG
jgi:hypothetical protein